MNQNNFKDRNIKDKDCDDDASWLLQLPDELKLEVFSFLPPKDLISLSKTCKELHGVIKDPRLWTELTVDLSETRRSLLMKVEKFPFLNTLKITNKTGLNLSGIRHSNKISNLARRTPQLKKIHFIGFYVDEDLRRTCLNRLRLAGLSCIGVEFASDFA